MRYLDSAGRSWRRLREHGHAEPVNEKRVAVPTYWVGRHASCRGDAECIDDLGLGTTRLCRVRRQGIRSRRFRSTRRHLRRDRALCGHTASVFRRAARRYTQPLLVKMDPRVTADSAPCCCSLTPKRASPGAMSRNHERLAAVRNVRKQVAKPWRVTARGCRAEIAGRQAGGLEGTGRGRLAVARLLAAGEPEGLARIAGTLTRIYDIVDSADAAPTAQALAALSESTKRWRNNWGIGRRFRAACRR